MQSDSQLKMFPQDALTRAAKIFKLVHYLMPKKIYVVYYRNIKFSLDHRMRLSKVHSVIEFAQNRWMDPFISLNTRMRAAAMNDMEKDFHMLMNKALYAKTGGNKRKRKDTHLVHERLEAAKVVDKPACLDGSIFREKLVRVEMQKMKMPFKKPSPDGLLVLDLSNLHMLNDVHPTYHRLSYDILTSTICMHLPTIYRFHN